ncbi:MAG: siroheme synthase [Alphaproteobacteria bacterium]|jgi:precorrin-2 dehydrogenase/sirohydrochlorin ferrochelatase|nr:siroheme synthase [Alphaproteobacteria bacterium]MBN9556728.1 siroheme synthase [Alphaproteobacteria bacterium]MBN9566832.1 siroheme synthase [Alphaproteobacteria bacterium]MBN9591459.1 siroheme synthase [Alphaproteobacteria bacterium]
MLPIIFDPANSVVGLVGEGEGFARRRQMLDDAGICPIVLDAGAGEGAIAAVRLLFVAGLENGRAARLARLARHLGVLVNVEDVPALCDFHVPASVRRGNLLLTISTGGRVPGLSRTLREWLETRFGPEWQTYLDDLSVAREGWRAEGLPPPVVSQRTRERVSEKGWLE